MNKSFITRVTQPQLRSPSLKRQYQSLYLFKYQARQRRQQHQNLHFNGVLDNHQILFANHKHGTRQLSTLVNNYKTNSIDPKMARQQTLGRFFSSMKKDISEGDIRAKVTKKSSKVVKNEDEESATNEASSEDSQTKRPRSRSRSRSVSPAKKSRSKSRSRSSSPSAKKQKTNDTASTAKKEDVKTENGNEEDVKMASSSSSNTSSKTATPQPEPEASKNDLEKLANDSIDKNPVGLEPSKPILYSALCDTFEQIEQVSSRLKIIEIVSEFFFEVLQNNAKSLVLIIYLFINKLGPDYDNLELGLGETLLIKAISESTGRSPANIKTGYRETGDLGKIAQTSRSKQSLMFKPKPLDVDTVFKNLQEIARSTGSSSQLKKIGIIVRMLTSCNGIEAKFLIRSLEGKLRIGLADKSILLALSKALLSYEYFQKGKNYNKINPTSISDAENQIKEAFNQVSNYQIIIESAIDNGVLQLKENIKLRPGIPMKPMLAKPTKSITEILDKFSDTEFTCEYKYDGERAQIHLLSDGSVKVYSRNSEDMTERYPDLIDAISNFIKPGKNVKSLIVDSEAVAWDREQQKILPFQTLSTRKRKDVKLEDIKVQICVFAFDLLCINDEPLIHKTFQERRDLMTENLQLKPGQFQFASYKNLNNVEDIQQYLDQSIKDSCEGLMIKLLSSTYEPSQRSSNWLKLKKDYLQGVGDSIDLVVLGGYYGRGKRTGWYGGFLLGCYNLDTGEYETTCKIGTGFSEEALKLLHEQLSPKEQSAPKPYYLYDQENSNSSPDVWFEPLVVFEVRTADLSLSPVYKAGSGKYDKGISLRFPRFIRIRDDKGPEDATNSDQLVDMYEAQVNI